MPHFEIFDGAPRPAAAHRGRAAPRADGGDEARQRTDDSPIEAGLGAETQATELRPQIPEPPSPGFEKAFEATAAAVEGAAAMATAAAPAAELLPAAGRSPQLPSLDGEASTPGRKTATSGLVSAQLPVPRESAADAPRLRGEVSPDSSMETIARTASPARPHQEMTALRSYATSGESEPRLPAHAPLTGDAPPRPAIAEARDGARATVSAPGRQLPHPEAAAAIAGPRPDGTPPPRAAVAEFTSHPVPEVVVPPKGRSVVRTPPEAASTAAADVAATPEAASSERRPPAVAVAAALAPAVRPQAARPSAEASLTAMGALASRESETGRRTGTQSSSRAEPTAHAIMQPTAPTPSVAGAPAAAAAVPIASGGQERLAQSLATAGGARLESSLDRAGEGRKAEIGPAAIGGPSSAPTGTPAAPGAVTSVAPPAAQAVADHAVRLARRETPGEVEIRLDPPELGRVRLSMTRHEQVLVVSVIAERPEVADLLRRNADMLGQSLSEAGAGQIDLQFGQAGDERDAPRGGFAETLDDPVRDDAPAPPLRAAALGGLDLRF